MEDNKRDKKTDWQSVEWFNKLSVFDLFFDLLSYNSYV